MEQPTTRRVCEKSGTFLIVFILMAMFYITGCDDADKTIENTISFHGKLSDYKIFTPNMAELVPEAGVEIYEIASPLFTDYAEKQRLLKIPDGQKLRMDGDGLPVFPDGSIIAKTFYYSKSKNGKRQIIETRLLIFKQGSWNAATYQWNAAQTNADLLIDGSTVPVTFADHSGIQRKLEYKIPSQNDCSSCHRTGDRLTPIGPKALNLNIIVDAEGKRQNQLAYFMKKGLFVHSDVSSIGSIPSYKDTTVDLSMRARAYFDINCGHCHQPAGMASSTSLNLGYLTAFEETGIGFNKQNILIRMSTMGEYHMPKTGTTILDDEGVILIKGYIKSLNGDINH